MECLEALLRAVGGGAPVPLISAHVANGLHRPRSKRPAADFVEGEPAAHPVVVAVNHGRGKAHKEVDYPTVAPAVVPLNQRVGHLEVRKRYQGLDAMSGEAVEDAIVEGKARFVGLALLTGGKDARPRDGETQHLEPHLGKERNILLVTMIEVDCFMAGIERPRLYLLCDPAGAFGEVVTTRHVVEDARALAVDVPRALDLVGRNGPSPEEILGK